MSQTLAVVPTYVRSEEELAVTKQTLRTLAEVEPRLDVLVVDDCSPDDELVREIMSVAQDLDFDVHLKEENTGYSETINVGLQRALETGCHVVTLNADMEFTFPFVERMEECRDSQDEPAAVVGGLLLFPNGLIQHAGVFFSFLNRHFDHRFRYGPGGLPEAHVPKVCPVTGAMQFIRWQTLKDVGIYDENFTMAHEDMDYCLRVFDSGMECVYDPGIRAIHHESFFRKVGQEERQVTSWEWLIEKHKGTGLGRWVPEVA